MDVISRVAGSTAMTPVTRTNREETAELRSTFAREVDSGENRGMPPVQGQQGQINTENNVSAMFSYLNNGTDLYGTGAPENGVSWGSGLFEDGGTAAATAATARENIEARSESLTNEIAYNSARGFDVTQSLEAVVNLSENLGVLDANMNSTAVSFAVDAATEGPVKFHGVPEDESNLTPAIAQEPEQPGFAVAGAFEGSLAEQIVQAASEQEEGEMSIAAQIASASQADHAASIDIMSEDGNADTAETVARVAGDSF
jgi:hypothetical protein